MLAPLSLPQYKQRIGHRRGAHPPPLMDAAAAAAAAARGDGARESGGGGGDGGGGVGGDDGAPGTRDTIVLKCALVGDSGVGKTSLLVRYVERRFDSSYCETVRERREGRRVGQRDPAECASPSAELSVAARGDPR